MGAGKLSARLLAIAGMVTPGNRVVDVGTDHAYIPVKLLSEGTAPSAIAMDISEGPLAHARENIDAAGLSDRCAIRRSDGLTAYRTGEADTCIVTGMGGRLIISILCTEPEKIRAFRELILEPQKEIEFFRESLETLGLGITEEKLVLEDGKFYPVLKAVPDVEPAHADWDLTRLSGPLTGIDMHRMECKFGPCLLAARDPVLKEYLLWLRGVDRRIAEGLVKKRGEAASVRLAEVGEDLRDIQTVLGCFYGA